MAISDKIRPIEPKDIPALKTVIDANDLFPSDMLDEMISDYFNNDRTSDLWFTYEDQKPIAIAYCTPEKMTEGTWNFYLIKETARIPEFYDAGEDKIVFHKFLTNEK